jgi:hypothetical protein
MNPALAMAGVRAMVADFSTGELRPYEGNSHYR